MDWIKRLATANGSRVGIHATKILDRYAAPTTEDLQKY